jgi:ubiquitin-conjugating enzyme E2 G1
MTAVNVGRELLKRQLAQLNNDEESGFSVGLDDDGDLFKWRVVFEGPTETPFEGGIFQSKLNFPRDFPNSPPAMFFITEMWHPNIYPDGKVCISILHPPGTDRLNLQETADERWRPIISVEAILISVQNMLVDPNLDSPANIDAAVQFKNDPKGYKRRVRELVNKSIESMDEELPKPSGPSVEGLSITDAEPSAQSLPSPSSAVHDASRTDEPIASATAQIVTAAVEIDESKSNTKCWVLPCF